MAGPNPKANGIIERRAAWRAISMNRGRVLTPHPNLLPQGEKERLRGDSPHRLRHQDDERERDADDHAGDLAPAPADKSIQQEIASAIEDREFQDGRRPDLEMRPRQWRHHGGYERRPHPEVERAPGRAEDEPHAPRGVAERQGEEPQHPAEPEGDPLGQHPPMLTVRLWLVKQCHARVVGQFNFEPPYYNFARVHQSPRVTPAMEAGVSDHVWSIEEIVTLIS